MERETTKKINLNIPSEFKLRVRGDSILNRRSIEIDEIDACIKDFGKKLIDMMFRFDGVGLAAPQVGVPLRIIALAVPRPDRIKNGGLISAGEELLCAKMPVVIVNPVLTALGKDCEIREEGCLSVPGVFADVRRPSRVFLEGIVNYNDKVSVECGGFLARVLQHEVDHLDGILFVDRLDKKTFRKIKKQLDELEKEYARKNFIREEK